MGIDVISSNIKRYRNNKCLTQKGLAELSGVPFQVITNIEREKGHLPEASILRNLSEALDCRPQDLVKPVRELSAVRFRARKKMRGREHILAQVSIWLENFNFLETLLSEKEEYKFSKLAESSEQLTPAQYAAAARKIIGLKDNEPIHNICGLLENAGIKILALPYSSDTFNGLSVRADGPAIVINTWEQISIERQIFSTAHELGHLLMHLSNYDEKVSSEDKIEEKEADLFAGYFLMPEKVFNSDWNETAGMPFVDRVMKIKRIFKVSYKVILYRLKQEGIVGDSIWVQFQQLFEEKYNRKLPYKEEPFPEGSEPLGLKSIDFRANRLSRLVRRALKEEQISMSRAADILNISTQDMMELANKWEPVA